MGDDMEVDAASSLGWLANAVLPAAFPCLRMSFSRCAADVFPLVLLSVALGGAVGEGTADGGANSSAVPCRRSMARHTGCEVWQKM
jgi:hypothetical protein